MFLSSGSGMKCRYYTNQPKQIKHTRIGQIVRVYCAWTLRRKACYKVQTQRTFFVQGSKIFSLCHKLIIYNPFIFAIWWCNPLIFQTYIIDLISLIFFPQISEMYAFQRLLIKNKREKTKRIPLIFKTCSIMDLILTLF